MAVVAGQIGADEIVGDRPSLGFRRAVGREDADDQRGHA